MKKISFLLLFVLYFGKILQAQITVTSADLPQVGQTEISYSDSAGFTNLSIDGPGGNKTWNFTNNWFISDTSYVTFVSPANLPGSGNFPTSNLAINSSDSVNSSIFFYRNDANGFDILGGSYQNASTTIALRLSTNSHFIPLPLVYGMVNPFVRTEISIADFSVGSLSKSIQTTTGTSTCDAWGTLSIPTGTFQVLRMKEETTLVVDSNFTDTTNTGNHFVFQNSTSNPSTTTSYLFFKNQAPSMVMSLQTNSGGKIDLSYYSQLAPLGMSDLSSTGTMNVFPNPATDVIYVTCDGREGSTFRMFDLSGKTVYSYQLSGVQKLELHTSGFERGMYLLEITDGEKQTVQRRKCVLR
jgi:hypothetical protein